MLELGRSGGIPPFQENFEYMLKYCNLETFPYKIHMSACRCFIYCILPLDYRYGSLQHLLMERFV